LLFAIDQHPIVGIFNNTTKREENKMKKTLKMTFFIALGALSLMAGEANATRIKSTSRGTPIIGKSGANLLKYRFHTSRITPAAFFYAAECAVDGGVGDTDDWLDLDIFVDGVKIRPTNGDNAFCTSKGTNKLDEWVSAATHGTKRLKAGWHTVRVTGRLVGWSAGDHFRIDDQSLIVIIEKF